jgi:hypothetical protein
MTELGFYMQVVMKSTNLRLFRCFTADIVWHGLKYGKVIMNGEWGWMRKEMALLFLCSLNSKGKVIPN